MSEQIFNVTSSNQQGGITAGQINIGNQERHLNSQVEQQLLDHIERHISSKDDVIGILTVMNNHEAYQFASEIKEFLEEKKYNVVGIDQYIFNKPTRGLHTESRIEGGINLVIGEL